MVLSKDPEIKERPFGEKFTLVGESVWNVRAHNVYFIFGILDLTAVLNFLDSFLFIYTI